MNKLTLNGVSYVYGSGTPFEKKALDNINLSFKYGIITGIIGHTGCGKSTLVQLLNGLLKPTEGTVLLDGHDIWSKDTKINDVRFRVGLVFQYPEYQLFEETVYKDIAFGPRNMGLDDAEIKRRVSDALVFTRLDESLLDKSPFEISGGQKRRVAIAGVIAMEPEVLILDEPAAGLDPMGREEILGGLWSYQRHRKSTVIIVSHSMEDMACYSDEIVVMNQGNVFMHGSCHDIFGEAEKLVGVGLDIPQITGLMLRLKAGGAPVETDIFTIADAQAELLSRLHDKGGAVSC